jgi:hypothetical protein
LTSHPASPIIEANGWRTSKTSYQEQGRPSPVAFGYEERAVAGLQKLRRAEVGASGLSAVRKKVMGEKIGQQKIDSFKVS